MIRHHWSIEVSFDEDASLVRKNRASENLSVLRKIALTRLHAATVPDQKMSVRRKMFRASLNIDFLQSRVFGSQ